MNKQYIDPMIISWMITKDRWGRLLQSLIQWFQRTLYIKVGRLEEKTLKHPWFSVFLLMAEFSLFPWVPLKVWKIGRESDDDIESREKTLKHPRFFSISTHGWVFLISSSALDKFPLKNILIALCETIIWSIHPAFMVFRGWTKAFGEIMKP